MTLAEGARAEFRFPFFKRTAQLVEAVASEARLSCGSVNADHPTLLIIALFWGEVQGNKNILISVFQVRAGAV